MPNERPDPGSTVRPPGLTLEETIRLAYLSKHERGITDAALAADAASYRSDPFQFQYPYLLEFMGLLRYCQGASPR